MIRRLIRKLVWKAAGRCLSCRPVFEPSIWAQLSYGRHCRTCGA